MLIYNVKENQDLFNKWDELSHRINSMRRIVLNDAEITGEDLAQWSLRVSNLSQELAGLALMIIQYVKRSDSVLSKD